ncbi:IS66 family insertion sequence element accessory protein TnpA, partial [Acinetobacter baumannii]|nr:IS66 family insertion sequence element accessory protein TnpB [Acinetobacter baumannii]
MHRTKEQWFALFAEQAQSGLTQTEFAKRQGIIPTYFSYRKRQLL